MREAVKKERFYLGQLAQTCEPTRPPPEKEKFGTQKVIFTVILLDIFGKKDQICHKIVTFKSFGSPDPTHPHLGHLP